MFLRLLFLALIICFAEGQKSIMIYWKLKSSLSDLMRLTDSSMVIQNIVSESLEREGETQCFSICDSLGKCNECGMPPPHSEEIKTYTVTLRSVTEISNTNLAAASMQKSLTNVLGEGNAQLPVIEESIIWVKVFISLSIRASYQEITTNHQSTISLINTLVNRTDSVCSKVCDAHSNICYDCRGSVVHDAESEFVVLFEAQISSAVNQNSNSANLRESIGNIYESDRVVSVLFDSEEPQLPRELRVVYVSMTVVSTIEEILRQKNVIKELINTITRYDVTCLNICSQDRLHCIDCEGESSQQISQVRRNYMLFLSSSATVLDLRPLTSKLITPLQFNFGEDDLISAKFTTQKPIIAIPTTAIPETLVPIVPLVDNFKYISVSYVIEINFSTLTSNSRVVTDRTQLILGGGGMANCTKICEMVEVNSQFMTNANCFECTGEKINTNRVSLLQSMRWEIVISGTTPDDKQIKPENLDVGIRGYLATIGGILHSVDLMDPKSSKPRNSSSGLSDEALVGIVVGSVVAVMLMSAIIYCLYKGPDSSDVRDLETRKEPV